MTLSRWHEDLAAHDEAFACLQDLLDPSSFATTVVKAFREWGQGPLRLATALVRENAALERENATLRDRIAELERSAALDSTTSSKPPASDGLRKKSGTQRRTRSQRGKSATPSGGQPGHKGTTLARTESPDHVVDHDPSARSGCGAPLSDADRHRAPVCRQVFDVPEPRPLEVTEHRAHRCLCGACATVTGAVFPDGVTAPVQYGPRITAWVSYLLYAQFVPEKRLAELMSDLFAVSISTATITAMGRRTDRRFEPFLAHVADVIRTAVPVKHLDETGLRIAARTRWLHVLCTPFLTVLRIGAGRGDVEKDLEGILIHDDYAAYFTLKGVRHGACNAHHLRELQALIDIEKEDWAKSMHRLLERAHRAGSTGRRNTFSLTGLQALVQSFGGSSPSEGLAGPCIERVSNNCEYVRTVCAQIGSFREVLSKQSIGVLVRSALPRAVRFAEVDGKAGCDPQIRMPGHLCSLVPGQRAAKLRWQCRDRPGDGIANRFSPMTGKRRPVLHARDGAVAFHSGKMQQHCEPRGAFHQSADRRSAQADDQVTFPVSGYGPISCFRRSFTDHDLRRDEGFAPPAATCPRHAQCPSRAKAGGQLTTECAAALYVERLIDRLMTDPHRLILGPVPRIVDPKTVRDLLRTPGPGPSPVLPRPMPTTVPDDAWPLDHRSIRCRDPTRKPILHIAPQRLIRCQLGWLRPFGGSISMPLRRRCSVVQATASGRRVAPHLAGDRRRCSLQPASNMTYASSLGAQKSNLLTFLERQVTS